MTSKPFSAKTFAPPDEKITGLRDKVVDFSRMKYGQDVKDVDAKIRKWVEMPFDLGMAIAEGKRQEKQKEDLEKEKLEVLEVEKAIDAKPGAKSHTISIKEHFTDSLSTGTIKIEQDDRLV